jgi:hypothetical protein
MSGTSNTTGIAAGACIERVRQMSLTPEQFALETGAGKGFGPAHPRAWMIFWKEDICENDEFRTRFPGMSMVAAQRVWPAMEDHFFARYEKFVRIWPEWCSSGIWAPPYPGSRRADGMIDYDYFQLPANLVARLKAWQAEFDDHEPWAPEKFDWDHYSRTEEALAVDLKAVLGPNIYVEHRGLMEILPDGGPESCRPRLGPILFT